MAQGHRDKNAKALKRSQKNISDNYQGNGAKKLKRGKTMVSPQRLPMANRKDSNPNEDCLGKDRRKVIQKQGNKPSNDNRNANATNKVQTRSNGPIRNFDILVQQGQQLKRQNEFKLPREIV